MNTTLKCITINPLGYLMQRPDGSRYYVMPRKMTPTERKAGAAYRERVRGAA